MSLRSQWPCWEIMKCDGRKKCIAKEVVDKMCWEIVQEKEPHCFHICADCLVFVSHQKDGLFSREEILSIMAQKGINVFERRGTCRCPQLERLAERLG